MAKKILVWEAEGRRRKAKEKIDGVIESLQGYGLTEEDI